MAPLPYRADIDGLRAVAVAGVLLFHFGFAGFSGGYAGVDVFFVISGFLITGILQGEENRGRFAFAGFYERRLRRIAPALLVVLMASALLCTGLLPIDMKPVGLGLINAALFTANFFFLTLAGDYFSSGLLGLQPTLHTWSLAVEAQFYALFPVLWVAGRRWPARRRAGLSFLAALSFGISLWGVIHAPEATFYLLPSRLWEFLLGGAVALLDQRPGPRLGGWMAAAGLALILASFLIYSPATPFPGAAALLPCLGALLVIGAGASPNPVSRLLGAPFLLFVGRRSYSLYLWHWPLLVFAAYGRPVPLPLAERLGLMALALLLAALSYSFVERPLIARRHLGSPRALLLGCGAGALAVVLAGLAINLAGQNKITIARLPEPVQRLAAAAFDKDDTDCRPDSPAPACHFGVAGTPPSVALWGNSFARMWRPALDQAASRQGVAGVSLAISRCPPLLGASFPALRGCESFNAAALAFLETHPELRTVLIGGDWDAWPAALPHLKETVAALQERGKRVVVILPPPQPGYDVPRALALAALRDDPAPAPMSEAAAHAHRATTEATLAGLATRLHVETLDPFPATCDGTTCAVIRDGHPLYTDGSHLSGWAARQASGLFDGVLAR